MSSRRLVSAWAIPVVFVAISLDCCKAADRGGGRRAQAAAPKAAHEVAADVTGFRTRD